MEKKFIYVVIEYARAKHSDETFNVVEVFESLESAQRCIKERKEKIKDEWKDYIGFGADWEEDEDHDFYELYRESDYEYYYKVEITEKELKK